MADTGKSRSTKDKEMASRLKKDSNLCERWVGRCCICYAIIRNTATYAHYSAHTRGAYSD